MDIAQAPHASTEFELRYEPLCKPGRTLAFPCDEVGRVDLDTLSERGRNYYFYARAMLGRQYTTGRVVPAGRADHTTGK